MPPPYDDDEDDDDEYQEYNESDAVECVSCQHRDMPREMRQGWEEGGETYYCYNDSCASNCHHCGYSFLMDRNPITGVMQDRCPAHRPAPDSLGRCANCSRDQTASAEMFTLRDGSHWCRSCVTAASARCSYCYSRYSRASNSIITGQRGAVYCVNCVGRNLWKCNACEAWVGHGAHCDVCFIREDGTKFRCGCGYGTKDRPIHSSSCRPRLVFHGESPDNLFFGFELETAFYSDENINKGAQIVRTVLQDAEIAQSKYDGSVSNGFEIVTQPTTFEHYMEKSDILWGVVDRLRTELGARSWDAGSCGLHIHISRKGFSGVTHLHRFIEFVYREAEMMMKFAGRKSSYAKFSDCWRSDPYDKPVFNIEHKMPSLRQNRTGGDRYTAVNTNNEATIELRFMRGTMNVDGVKSGLSLAHAMVEYTRHMEEDAEEKWKTWGAFADYVSAHESIYPELMARMPLIKDVDITSKVKMNA